VAFIRVTAVAVMLLCSVIVCCVMLWHVILCDFHLLLTVSAHKACC